MNLFANHSFAAQKKRSDKQRKAARKKQLKQTKKAAPPKSVQQTLPFVTIHEDGICEIGQGKYSRSIGFDDMNYQIARRDDKIAIFEAYCSLINSADQNTMLQITLNNEFIDTQRFERNILIAERGDAADLYRGEYNQMLANQIKQGKNCVRKTKFLTFSVLASGLDDARVKLGRIEDDLLQQLKRIGCQSFSLDGTERLKVLHDIYRQCGSSDFQFDYADIWRTGLTPKDFIAPNSLSFKEKKRFMLGQHFAQVSFLRISAPELSDRFLSDLTELTGNMTITLNIKSIPQNEAVKRIRKQLAIAESNKISEQRKAVKSGFDMDMIPSDLKNYIAETERFLAELQDNNQRMFEINFLILNVAETQEQLDSDVAYVQSIAQKFNCDLQPLEEQQENGLASVMPIGASKVDIWRTMHTAGTAIFVPFITQELLETSGSYYGLNAVSRNLIIYNRKKKKLANGFILGTPGSGKSFAAKREMVNVFLSTEDDIIVLDPEREYSPLCHILGGEVVHIAANSKNYINPFDMSLDYADEDDPLLLKSDFVLSLCDTILGGRDGLTPFMRSVVDRCVGIAYRKYMQNPTIDTIPTLSDFLQVLQQQKEAEAQIIATALELYVTGSLKVFNNKTNFNTNNRFIVYDTKDLGKQLKNLGLLIVLDQIWNRITMNREQGKRTWVYIDEAHLFFANDYSANFLLELYKRARKWGAIPTGITQNVEDLLLSDTARKILSNCEFILMLNQATSDRIELAKLLNISKQQLSYVTNADEGQGLLFSGKCIIPFIDRFPKDTKLYKVMTTKPDEVEHFKKV